MSGMTEELYNNLCKAGKTLCDYCECAPDDCESCKVTHLLNDAANEAVDAGIIDE